MNPFEQLELLKKNVSKCEDPAVLFAMNQRARELQTQCEAIKKITVTYSVN